MDETTVAVLVVASISNFLIGIKLLIGQHRIAKNQIELAEFIRSRTGQDA